jgi:serine/threonine-protein kinase HipA
MKIGGEYSSESVTAKNFEQLAQEAGLGKPSVRARVTQMAERVIAARSKVEIAHPVAESVASLIRRRSEKVRNNFSN